MLCLLCDAVLDMVSSIGISLIIFGTYVPQYTDPHGMGFPFPNWFDDHWLANMQQEFQMMLVASWGDMVSRLVFALGLLQCMEAIKEMLTPVPVPIPSIAVTHDDKKSIDVSPVVPLSEAALTRFVAPVTAASTDDKPKEEEAASIEGPSTVSVQDEKVDDETTVATATAISNEPASAMDNSLKSSPSTNAIDFQAVKAVSATKQVHQGSRSARVFHFLVHVIGPATFVLWGFVILITHIVAETHHSNTACELKLKPWFSSKPGCSIIEVNCHDLQSTGQDDLMLTALETFDPERAARVVFRHCPALVMTSKLQEFKNMAGLKIYNSTVVSWGKEAAITATHHPNMRSVFIVRTTFPSGELPPGLLSTDFPPMVKDMITCVTNLHTIPDDVDTKWAPGIQVALEYSQFTEIPAVVLRLQPSLISMAGSLITSLPAAVFEVPSLGALIVGSTHIQDLPRDVTKPAPYLGVLFLQDTTITTFWAWIDGLADRQAASTHKLFNAHGTPYCRELADISAGNRTGFSVTPAPGFSKLMDVSTPEKRAFAERVVDCTPGFPSHFPLPLEDAMHGLH